MEPIITPQLLASTGIDVPDEQVVPLLEYMNGVLEERVGEAVVTSLSDEQLEMLASLQETSSDEEIQNWMSVNISDLPEIVQNEIDIILGEASEHQEAFSAQQ